VKFQDLVAWALRKNMKIEIAREEEKQKAIEEEKMKINGEETITKEEEPEM
jgi:hypothetical protein